MATALISLGSNLGDRKLALDAAVEKLRTTPGIDGVVVSSYHATKPIGGPLEQAEFLNAAARIETSLSPHELLGELQRIEKELGRVREEHWGPRTLDLDLLLYGDLVISEPDLIVPHRFLPFRRFVLTPVAEVAADMRHPTLGWTVQRMLSHLEISPARFGVVGKPQATVTALIERLGPVADMSGVAPLRALFLLGEHDLPQDIPALLLPTEDLDRAVREAVAAIQAMQ
jgi:2-amino-4-hydroxy-6-hydroxymethyldihydropteridine diphosphokinase